MIRTLFADTFYYLALVNPGDKAHTRAAAFSRQSKTRLLTTAWIIQELADGLCHAKQRHLFVRLLAAIRGDSNTELIHPDSSIWEAGLQLYASRSDKNWSLTDCISFVVMQERMLREALTGDHHFKQAGFLPLLME